jgi:hypothetical protein
MGKRIEDDLEDVFEIEVGGWRKPRAITQLLMMSEEVPALWGDRELLSTCD